MDKMSVININRAYTNCIAEQWTATTVHSLKYYNHSGRWRLDFDSNVVIRVWLGLGLWLGLQLGLQNRKKPSVELRKAIEI